MRCIRVVNVIDVVRSRSDIIKAPRRAIFTRMDTTQVERRRTRVVGLVKSHLEFLGGGGGQAKTLKFNFVFLFRNTEISWIDNPEGMELESKIFDCFAVSDVWITVRLLKMRAIRKRSTYDHLS